MTRVWTVQTHLQSRRLIVSDGWHVDWPIRVPDGRILYDWPERIPAYARRDVDRAFKAQEALRG